MGLRILTYNIHGLPWIQCPIEAILLWIYVKCRCDILCLQEVFSKKLKQKILALAPKYNYRALFPEREPRCLGKPLLGFHTPSGLCILVRSDIPIVRAPRFDYFYKKTGLDALVNKGVFSVGISHGGHSFTVFNTHFQADFNEVPCCPMKFEGVRASQEAQLYWIVSHEAFPLVVGDYNKKEFRFFDRFDPEDRVTFPHTGEHLDHLLLLKSTSGQFKSKGVSYFPEVRFSDHLPVLFEFEI